jgi:hypothetical protein
MHIHTCFPSFFKKAQNDEEWVDCLSLWGVVLWLRETSVAKVLFQREKLS